MKGQYKGKGHNPLCGIVKGTDCVMDYQSSYFDDCQGLDINKVSQEQNLSLKAPNHPTRESRHWHQTVTLTTKAYDLRVVHSILFNRELQFYDWLKAYKWTQNFYQDTIWTDRNLNLAIHETGLLYNPTENANAFFTNTKYTS